MHNTALIDITSKVAELGFARTVGRVSAVDGHSIHVSGLQNEVKLTDRLKLKRKDGSVLMGEVLRIEEGAVTMLPDKPPHHVALKDPVTSLGPVTISPSDHWLGRVIDPYGNPLDGLFLAQGPLEHSIQNDPPAAVLRKPFGARLNTGFHLFNTLLPIVRGQRIGVFAGAGVGKSTLLADFVQNLDADVVVLALVGERGREIRDFTHRLSEHGGLARSVVVAASAETAPTTRMHCPLTAMRIAEHFRDQGLHVLLLVDSITRFAEAHREAAIAGGEYPGLRGFPASTPGAITRLAERAGPGVEGAGDITAVFSVLVPGDDMDEPVADMLRGVLDGHLILDRELAEQGHFPAVDVPKSLSRALPDAANDTENGLITQARALLSTYRQSSALIAAGLYTEGRDPDLDRAIAFEKLFKAFRLEKGADSIDASFEALSLCLRRSIGNSGRV